MPPTTTTLISFTLKSITNGSRTLSSTFVFGPILGIYGGSILSISSTSSAVRRGRLDTRVGGWRDAGDDDEEVINLVLGGVTSNFQNPLNGP